MAIDKGYWAIDCGATESFTSTTNIMWEPDGNYVHGGVIRTVSNTSVTTFTTLRAFEAEKPAKGCYTIPVGEGKKVQVSAWFYYGNYDNLMQPPTFRLQFDANEWAVIQTSMTDYVSRSVIYVAKTNATKICVARGSTGHTPFISSLHVSILSEGMYKAVDHSRALFWQSRVAFGANDGIRDKYFRYWSSTTSTLNISDYKILNNEATFNEIIERPDDVPLAVLRSAITPSSSSSNITISTPFLPSTETPIYFNMYFTEPVNPAGRGGDRSFNIFVDGKQLTIDDGSTAVVPQYGGIREIYSAHVTGSNTTVFDLVSTADGTLPPHEILPPVISAWELFIISGSLNNGTDRRDVDGLSAFQDKFKNLQAWAGDPCLPNQYNWEWVTCSEDTSPRIIKLDLRGYGLSGELPDFRSLDALQSIDLSNNSLTGDIPTFLAEMPNLQILNLAENDFRTIPSALVQNGNIHLDVSGNPKLPCMGQACSPATAPEAQMPSSVEKGRKGVTMAILSACIIHVVAAVAR